MGVLKLSFTSPDNEYARQFDQPFSSILISHDGKSSVQTDEQIIIKSYLSENISTLSLILNDICSMFPMPLITPPVKNIKEVTEPLKEEILNGNVHTIDDMKAWLKPLGYSDAINEAATKFILREFVMSKVSADVQMNQDQVVELLRPQLEVTKEDIEPIIIMGLYHYRDLIGSPSAFIKTI